ncbi:hypothetical protein SCATT_24230 [Streptantibioticus cattleyicolor NRRL 8057 = DSM 46488]|uniref:Uncharacterized protein n=1 Tax=Streptantibioticus cattleyicolor (strain ATCC 35852 / DSM 46488 / JCM 4925 / NBRC 14057 / NRRL 8057) TaxID=1003195 RepID=G8WS34_STREN|nr:hypothetical protein SCATT_24230 [Streptantibioticus cattleyicolor NRRL 8057 = DSM 46488]
MISHVPTEPARQSRRLTARRGQANPPFPSLRLPRGGLNQPEMCQYDIRQLTGRHRPVQPAKRRRRRPEHGPAVVVRIRRCGQYGKSRRHHHCCGPCQKSSTFHRIASVLPRCRVGEADQAGWNAQVSGGSRQDLHGVRASPPRFESRNSRLREPAGPAQLRLTDPPLNTSQPDHPPVIPPHPTHRGSLASTSSFVPLSGR